MRALVSPCPSLVPGQTYLVMARGVGSGGATFGVNADGTVERIAHCGPLSPLPRLTDYYCQMGHTELCGTDDLGAALPEEYGEPSPQPSR
jgi:hypothetical protein